MAHLNHCGIALSKINVPGHAGGRVCAVLIEDHRTGIKTGFAPPFMLIKHVTSISHFAWGTVLFKHSY